MIIISRPTTMQCGTQCSEEQSCTAPSARHPSVRPYMVWSVNYDHDVRESTLVVIAAVVVIPVVYGQTGYNVKMKMQNMMALRLIITCIDHRPFIQYWGTRTGRRGSKSEENEWTMDLIDLIEICSLQ
jgi:hypothetical protein